MGSHFRMTPSSLLVTKALRFGSPMVSSEHRPVDLSCVGSACLLRVSPMHSGVRNAPEQCSVNTSTLKRRPVIPQCGFHTV